MRNSVEQKKRWVAAMNAGVSPEGQRLFMAIAKTIHEVSESIFEFKKNVCSIEI